MVRNSTLLQWFYPLGYSTFPLLKTLRAIPHGSSSSSIRCGSIEVSAFRQSEVRRVAPSQSVLMDAVGGGQAVTGSSGLG